MPRMVGPSGFHVDEASGSRWQLALELLTTPGAETVMYRGIGLWNGRDRSGRPDPACFTAAIQSSWGMERVTEATARDDLERARSTIADLRAESPEFDDIVGERVIQYLLLDDYGMGAVHLAVLGPQGLEWLRNPEPA